MKRLVLLFILTLFIFNISGYYFLFLFLDSENRNEMQYDLVYETSLQTIRISKSEQKNIIMRENGKEISYNGENYDVKSISEEGDFIMFKCISDKNENNLVAQLSKNLKNNSNSNSSEKKQSINPAKDLFFYTKNIFSVSASEFVFPVADCQLPTAYLAVFSPPPKA